MGHNPFHPGILDAKLLLEEGQFVVQAVDLGPEPGPMVSVVRGAGDQGGEGVVAEGEYIKDRGLRLAIPGRFRGILGRIGASEGFR